MFVAYRWALFKFPLYNSAWQQSINWNFLKYRAEKAGEVDVFVIFHFTSKTEGFTLIEFLERQGMKANEASVFVLIWMLILKCLGSGFIYYSSSVQFQGTLFSHVKISIFGISFNSLRHEATTSLDLAFNFKILISIVYVNIFLISRY